MNAYISTNTDTGLLSLKESAEGANLGTTGTIFATAANEQELLDFAAANNIDVSSQRMASGKAARLAYERALGV